VVSLAPNMTELLFALGVGERVVGVTRFCNHPPEAATRAVVGGYTDPSVEAILALRPDLVVVPTGPGAAPAVDGLTRHGVPVYWSYVDDVADIVRTARELGPLVGAPAAGEREAQRLTRALAPLPRGAGPAPRVVAAVGAHPLLAAGPGTYLDELIRLAGARNALADARAAYPTLSEESMLTLHPDVLLDLAMAGERLPAHLLASWRAAGVRIVPLQADLYLRPGPRLDQALAGLRDALRPPHEGASGAGGASPSAR